MSEERWPLGPRAARVFYNVADAWLEGAEGDDVVAGLAAAGIGSRDRRRTERMLWLLEWSPRLLLRSRRGFSWLPRAERRAWLDRLATRGPAPVRAALAELRRLVEAAAP